MPKSRKRKKHPVKKAHSPGGVAFSQFSIGEENHEAFKEAMLSAARQSVAEFPDQVETLLKVLRERMPNGVLATFGFYGTRATIDDDGATRPFAKDVLQHHIELLQALILTLPFEDWGSGPSSGDAMQVIFDTVPVIADTFVKMRIAEHEDEPDPQRQAILSLQEKIRLHTQAVRNWGYYGEVIRITRELYAPLDGPLSEKVGFSASDVIDIAEKLVSVVEDRSGEHINVLRRVLRGKTVDDLARLYYQHMPGLRGNAQDLIDIVPVGTPREGLIGWLLSHSDMRHFDMMAFSAAEVAALTNKPVEVVGKVLDALSLSPGALAGTEVRHLFLANPVWARPGLKLGDSYLFAIPQSIFSHINEIMRNIAADAKVEETLANRRASYLEGKMVETLQAALPSARITPNAKWTVGDQQVETDAIVVVDRALIIAEAKSSRVTPQALRGAPDRLKRHLAELVIDPSVQSERLADLIASARNGDAPAQAVMTSLNIDAGSIDNVIRISVTLDDLSILSSSEEELSDVGLIPQGRSLAPSLHIADLMCIAEIIDNELFFIHYFAERFHFQKQFDLFGDELDFLGLYLATGFNLGPKRDDFKRMMISGMSGPMDRFYDGRDAGLKVLKPKVELRRVYRDIVDRLLQRKPKGWSTIGIHLLNSASPEEQKEVERGLIRLRKSVSRKSKPPNHECFMSIVPALDRKATIGFFMYLEAEKGDRRAKMQQLGIEALEREGAQTCVIFGKNADRWSEPYEVVLFVQAEEAA